MPPIRYDTLANRLRSHLMEDPRIGTEQEASAEIDLMTNVELVETLSLVLGRMLTEIEDGVGVAFEKTPPHSGGHPERPAP